MRSPANPEYSRSLGELGLRGNYDSPNVRARERGLGSICSAVIGMPDTQAAKWVFQEARARDVLGKLLRH